MSGNGTCEVCDKEVAVFGCRYCQECYYIDGVPRDVLEDRIRKSLASGMSDITGHELIEKLKQELARMND